MTRFRPFLLALIALASCAEPAPTAPPVCAGAGLGNWEFLGLRADTLGTVGHVAASPHDPDLLLAAARADFSSGLSGQLFRSDDGGQTWGPVLATGTFGGGTRDLAFDFADPAGAYALPYGVAKSEDGGWTWFPADEGIQINFDTGAQALVQVPSDPTGRTLLVGTAGFSGGSLYRSEDGAQTWADLSPPLEVCLGPDPPDNCSLGPTISLAADPSDPDVLYAGQNWSGHVVRSGDGGVTWTLQGELPSGLPVSLLVDASDPGVLYAASQPGSKTRPAHRSMDRGQTWEAFSEGLPEPYSGGTIVQDPVTGTLYLTGSHWATGALWRRDPGEGSWTAASTPVAGILSTSALTLTAEGWLYVGGEGLWRVDLRTLTATEPGPCDP